MNFRPGDADAAAVARRIMLEADGVRATPDGANSVIVSTIAGGSDVRHCADQERRRRLGNSTGKSANLPGRAPVTDTGAVDPLVLRGVVADAVTRDVLPYVPPSCSRSRQ